MNKLYSKYKFLKSKGQPKNLKKLLTKARFDSVPITAEVKKCSGKKCELCTYILEGSTFQFKCGITFTISQQMSCDIKNVIYVIHCANCGLEYIGENGNLRKRVNVHNQQIRDPSTRILKVSTHIDTCPENHKPKYRIVPFYIMNKASAIARRDKETYFIRKFKPALNGRL